MAIVRTQTHHLNPLIFEDGKSSIEFFAPSKPNESARAIARADPGSKVLTPPFHWHWTQDEAFRVLEGEVELVEDGIVKILTPQAGWYTSRARCNHVFKFKAPGTRLEVVPSGGAMEGDEAFFRNMFGCTRSNDCRPSVLTPYSYLDDCLKAKRDPNPLQMMVFLNAGGVSLALPGPKAIMQPLSRLLGFIMGHLGLLAGFKASYAEYSRPKTT